MNFLLACLKTDFAKSFLYFLFSYETIKLILKLNLNETINKKNLNWDFPKN
jgi:hypothetical protein